MSNDSHNYLSIEEENTLIKEYQDKNSKSAESKLVESYMPLIRNIEKGLRGYNMDHNDMIQEGVIGFIRGLPKYDRTKGFTLATFITPYVKNAMLEYVFKNIGIVRTITTKNHKRAFYNINRYRDNKGKISQKNIEKFANDYDMTLDKAKDAISRISVSYDPILSTGTTNEEDFSNGYIHDLENPIGSPEDIIERSNFEYISTKALYEAIDTLNEREKDIVSKRWLSEETYSLTDLSKVYNVSVERIRQLENQAIKRMSKYMKENYEL
jgi:RNA polymerase sigma-32 factor